MRTTTTRRPTDPILVAVLLVINAAAFALLSSIHGLGHAALTVIGAAAAGAVFAGAAAAVERRARRIRPRDRAMFVVPLDQDMQPVADPELVSMRQNRDGTWRSVGAAAFACSAPPTRLGIQEPTYVPGRHDWFVTL